MGGKYRSPEQEEWRVKQLQEECKWRSDEGNATTPWAKKGIGKTNASETNARESFKWYECEWNECRWSECKWSTMRTHQKYTEKFEPTKNTMRTHQKHTEKFEPTKSTMRTQFFRPHQKLVAKKSTPPKVQRPHQKYIEISDPTKSTFSNPKTHQKYNFLYLNCIFLYKRYLNCISYIESIYFRFVELRNYFDTCGVASKLQNDRDKKTVLC